MAEVGDFGSFEKEPDGGDPDAAPPELTEDEFDPDAVADDGDDA